LNIKDVDSSAKSLNNEEATDDGITAGDDPELYQYYYHADHLGSASYITNLDGEIAQYIEYVPFGKGATVIGEGLNQHVVANYGQSKDGTNYVFSKAGRSFKPEVITLQGVMKQYNTTKVKFYQKND